MREPTFEEMVEGIRRAVSDELELMRYDHEGRPQHIFPSAFEAAMGEWLKELEERIADELRRG